MAIPEASGTTPWSLGAIRGGFLECPGVTREAPGVSFGAPGDDFGDLLRSREGPGAKRGDMLDLQYPPHENQFCVCV